ncbi:Glucose / Sorbosone dehydrogenase [Pseudovibrio axinellae]|uniref:Glucose / Sorbosone dehydrogenase n=1 Tax=Pseudovibrio axinellae TaxID=989403 RepID=A0A165T6F1_9HYPH|nr:PQQ-dependent sugar dehydrogenase [Pseudovibrio axinellae]KZL05500.1 Glucose / Sorbosone dehydrogenase [Pseudovibrio axinellae]SEP96552.1 Glucose/arabinose dehydrogenase, beta-propeller fold [Pseudovibrio axinellae]
MQTIKTVVYGAVTACACTLFLSATLAAPTTRDVDDVPTEFVEQDAAQMRVLARNANVVVMPKGFHIEPYAVVPDARHMAVAPDGKTVFVGTTSDRVWVLTQDQNTHKVEQVRQFAPAERFTIPNGVCFTSAGALVIAEQNRILSFPDALKSKELSKPAFNVLVALGDLIPAAEESYSHSARVCDQGSDGRIYISLGQPYNVSPKNKLELYERLGIGGIISINDDGSDRQVYATGIRNSVGMEFHPSSGNLWFTDNQVDRMGDDIPPEELNKGVEPGKSYGFPWYGGGTVRTPEYAGDPLPPALVNPQVELDAHAASLGMTFYQGNMFPQAYRGGVFIAQHGSWDRSVPIGARVVFVPLDEQERPGTPMIVASGWIDSNGEYLGRPVDVVELGDGSLLISDDSAGGIYRLSYEE